MRNLFKVTHDHTNTVLYLCAPADNVYYSQVSASALLNFFVWSGEYDISPRIHSVRSYIYLEVFRAWAAIIIFMTCLSQMSTKQPFCETLAAVPK